MMPAAALIGGAKGRLLPASLVFRFFAAAVIYHIAMWLMLAAAADDIAVFSGGPGPALAAFHLLTLGVLLLTVIGAAPQLLSVATKRPIRSLALARLLSWLIIPGVAVLTYGMAVAGVWAMAIGAGMCVAALVIFGGLIGDNLRAAKGMGVTIAYCWVALAALAALVALGLALIFDYTTPLLPDHGRAALAHMLLGGFGFMGLLAMGFSHLLVPMFALAHGPSPASGYVALAAATAGLISGVAGVLAGSPGLMALGGLAALIGVAIHVIGMARIYRARMKKRLGVSFLLVRVGWAFLPASLILAIALAAGIGPANGPLVFAAALFGGWLLTFLLGILQRIIPFLAAMHAPAPTTGGRPPTPAGLTWPAALNIHAGCHLTAMAALLAGLVLGNTEVILAAAGIGTVGAVAFALFALTVLRRARPAP